jgi:diguanylate cyclase (GGDEF)-like protein
MLVGTACFTVALAGFVYDRELARGLRASAEARLVRAARSARLLIESHQGVLESRYRALGGTPQVVATLELEHAPTTQVLADQVRERYGAAWIGFADERGALLAQSGSVPAAAANASGRRGVVIAGGRGYLAVSTQLPAGRRKTAQLVALEPIDAKLLAHWSELCGAVVALGPPGADDALVARLDGGLYVVGDRAPERAALATARAKLAISGAAAIAATLLASLWLARGLVRPVRRIRAALGQIESGDFSVRFESARSDEIGEVARGVDSMADRLRATHAELAARMEELRRDQAHLARAQQMARLGSFEFDLATHELTGSDEFWVLCGASDRLKGLSPAELLERVDEADRASVVDALRSCVDGAAGAIVEFRVHLPDRGDRCFQAQCQLISVGGAARLQGTVQDVTESRRAEEQVRFLAYHDPLTGLGNRQLLGDRLKLATEQARRRGDRLAMLYLDLDEFKRINDTLGHSTGDELLRQVADRLVTAAREASLRPRAADRDADTALCRLGGDEFGLLVTHVRDTSDLAHVAEHLLSRVRRPYRVAQQDLVVSASVGIAIWPTDGSGYEELITHADAAMYHAKAKGRNTFAFYDASMNEAALRRLRVEMRLRHALEHGGLELAFQPKLELASGRVIGFEALARWDDPELGVVSPQDFIVVAEQTGLIAPFGRWLLRRVCEEVRARERVLAAARARVSFNVSVQEFGPRFVESIAETLSRTGVDPRRLQIEVTESSVMRNEETAISALQELAALGISIALDDFGTGYSSLSYLQRLPVDTLKLDRSFISSITENPEAAALTRGVVAMGSALGLAVVAEGVETERQREILAECGCQAIQGYLVGEPQPADVAFLLLRRRAA